MRGKVKMNHSSRLDTALKCLEEKLSYGAAWWRADDHLIFVAKCDLVSECKESVKIENGVASLSVHLTATCAVGFMKEGEVQD